tara:strand:- start:915 stop:1157 length:243 start_codon:yes stop_codon:yes gene_type:complete
MTKTLNIDDYENYLREHVKHYVVTIFKGRGKYGKVAFENLKDAVTYRNDLKTANPLARCIVYGISQPPCSFSQITIDMKV